MATICKNCRYFVQGSSFSPQYIWGDCMKQDDNVPGTGDNRKRSTFTWADKTCSDFKLGQKSK
jgi:hypothetical protein